MISRWMPTSNVQLYGRTPQPWVISGSRRVSTTGFPKFALLHGPHSPLAVPLRRSQSGTKLRLASFHDRLVVVAIRFPTAESPPSTELCDPCVIMYLP